VRKTVSTAVLAFAAGVLLTLALKEGGNERAGTPRAQGQHSPQSADRVARIQELETRLERSEARRVVLEKEVTVLRERVAASPAGGTARGSAATGGTAGTGPRFLHRDVEEGLRAADWDAVGDAAAKLMPLLAEARAVIEGEAGMRREFWGELTQQLGPIFTYAVELESNGVSWSHPSALANLVHATLRSAGRPLTEKQEDELDRVGLRYVDEYGRRLASYGDGTLALRRRIDEVLQQDRFYSEVAGLLNEAQRDVLWPKGVRGIAGLDVFSGAVMWDEHRDRLRHSDRDDLRERAFAVHMQDLGLRAELRPNLATLVDEWCDALPDAFVDAAPAAYQLGDDDTDGAKRVLFAAERQLRLYERLLETAPLNAAERERVLEQDRVHVPLRTR
jgi:hypothetical protein